MFAEIILSQRFPKHLGIFDYKIPDSLVSQIKIGQLVTIPFRKSEKEGVVVKIKKTSITGKTIKPITKINQLQPIITQKQLELADWMSAYYFVSQGTVIKTMLPPIPQKKSNRGKTIAQKLSILIKPSVQIIKLTKELKNGQQKNYLFWPHDPEQLTQFFYQTITNTTGQVLIIVPEISNITDLMNILPEKLYKKIVIIHSQLNKNQLYNAWQSIIKDKTKIIIGTKLAVFAPIQKPELIILYQEENKNHKQSDQNPRFDACLVAEQIAKLHNTKILFTSFAPSIEAYEKLGKKIKLLQIKGESIKTVQFIDMKNERKKQNYSVFSEELQEQTDNTLNQNGQTFFFINKRGHASSVICQDCGEVLLCQQCQLPFIYHQTGAILFCHRCNKKSELPPFCPKCSGTNFKFIGVGTQKIEQEAKKLWPKSKIARLDQDIKKPANLKYFDIIIGTELAFNYLNWHKIKLIGIISADTYLHLPDFRATEKTWQLLKKIHFYSKCPTILQTYSPNHPAIKYFPNKIQQFYQTEINDRQDLAYPPFASIIKLIYQHKDKKHCLSQTQKVYHAIKTSPLNVMLATPFKPYLNGKWQMYIIIKYQLPTQQQTLDKVISQVPDNWIIDRDPENLL